MPIFHLNGSQGLRGKLTRLETSLRGRLWATFDRAEILSMPKNADRNYCEMPRPSMAVQSTEICARHCCMSLVWDVSFWAACNEVEDGL